MSRRRDYPYFKYQVFSDTSVTWLENKKTFDSIEQLKAQIRNKGTVGRIRIIRVDEDGYRDVEELEILDNEV